MKLTDKINVAVTNAFFLVPVARAQSDVSLEPVDGSTFKNLVNFEATNVVSVAVTILFIVAAVIFFFMLVIGGIRWILSAGDKGKMEAARSQITAALIGLIIVFSAYAIVRLINTFFGIDILNLDVPSI